MCVSFVILRNAKFITLACKWRRCQKEKFNIASWILPHVCLQSYVHTGRQWNNNSAETPSWLVEGALSCDEEEKVKNTLEKMEKIMAGKKSVRISLGTWNWNSKRYLLREKGRKIAVVVLLRRKIYYRCQKKKSIDRTKKGCMKNVKILPWTLIPVLFRSLFTNTHRDNSWKMNVNRIRRKMDGCALKATKNSWYPGKKAFEIIPSNWL